MKEMRIGYGNDIHRLDPGRRLILGGVEIPHEKGLLGHSDADAVIHAVIDAWLGALALGDIGGFFPDTDPAYRDIDSRELLRRVLELPESREWRLGNLDVTVNAQRPRLAPYLPAMRRSLAESFGCGVERISVKAKTGEKLGYVGREEGISAEAVLLLRPAGEEVS